LYAPQNLYLTADADPDGRRDSWVAVSIATEEHWDALRRALGDPEWARDPALARVEGRREAHDLLDEHLGAWCATRSTDEIVATLWDAGVPVGAAVRAFELEGVEQLRARGYFESLEHPIVGEARFQGFPTRYEHGPRQLHRRPSPTLGQHNDEVLSGLLGLGSEELAELRAAKVIGERLGGNAR
jgi:crotonobetainyl-CoA:carnitine CoA-transferase CaiB-like acyl-CoA transferase